MYSGRIVCGNMRIRCICDGELWTLWGHFQTVFTAHRAIKGAMNVTNKSLTPYMFVILTEKEKADFAWRRKHTTHRTVINCRLHQFTGRGLSSKRHRGCTGKRTHGPDREVHWNRKVLQSSSNLESKKWHKTRRLEMNRARMLMQISCAVRPPSLPTVMDLATRNSNTRVHNSNTARVVPAMSAGMQLKQVSYCWVVWQHKGSRNDTFASCSWCWVFYFWRCSGTNWGSTHAYGSGYLRGVPWVRSLKQCWRQTTPWFPSSASAARLSYTH